MSDDPSAQVADRIALADLAYAYVDALDRRDWDRLRGLFARHATLDYTAFGGPRGNVETVIPWLEASLGIFAFTQHHITNQLVDVGGDEAAGRLAFYNPMGIATGDGLQLLSAGGYYHDRYVRTPDGWRIAGRRIEATFLETAPRPGSPGPR